ncbi:expansin-YoaJ [Aspergillus udagawae]|uniref:Expansin-YoaJ n=1 Tax=Aspergillus udagawae TaxID=91492 RepID=A0A8H3SHP5_9EURO|nr:expansin-YoaJ [Aspergillus udagawae]GFF60094.1 expansin-YoaJ [Aspergillus udagawae]
MYLKTAIACLTGLSTVVNADVNGKFKTGRCPVGYAQITYLVTVTESSTSTVNPFTAGLSTAISQPTISTWDGSSTISSSPSISEATKTDSTGETSATSPSTPAEKSLSTPTTISDAIVNPTVSMVEATPTSASSIESSQTSVVDVSQKSASSSQGSETPLVGGIVSGQATSYDGGDVDGTCMFSTADYTLPAGIYGAALSVDNWDSAAWCGACLSVVGPRGNSIKIMIVNQCPGTCGLNNIDLLPNGFQQLADLKVGRIDVKWDIVKCDISSPLFLKTKTGSSKYWFSIQVVNSNVPVKSLEVSTDGGQTWQSTIRKDYNFFENPNGFGTDFVDVRITSVMGETIMVNNVSSVSETRTDATSNFN